MTKPKSIHPTAQIDPSAEIAEDVTIGPGTVIEAGVKIGNGCSIGQYAYISGDTTLGAGCRIFPYAVVGNIPQDLKFKGEQTRTILGQNVVVREFASIHRGTAARDQTVIGDDCLIMAYAHIAHDCILGNHVIVSNSTQLAGHIDVGDWAIIGGMTAVQQFIRIGAHAFVGGMCRIIKDVPPFVIVADIPTYAVGINVEGLKRRGFSQEIRTALRKAYQILYRQGLTASQAVVKMRADFPHHQEVLQLAEFIASAGRGIMPSLGQFTESSTKTQDSNQE